MPCTVHMCMLTRTRYTCKCAVRHERKKRSSESWLRLTRFVPPCPPDVNVARLQEWSRCEKNAPYRQGFHWQALPTLKLGEEGVLWRQNKCLQRSVIFARDGKRVSWMSVLSYVSSSFRRRSSCRYHRSSCVFVFSSCICWCRGATNISCIFTPWRRT